MQIIARERGNDMKTQISCGTQINSFYKEDTKNAVKKSRILRQKTALFIFGFCTKIQKTTKKQSSAFLVFNIMAFFNSAIGVLQTLVIALGAGLGIWGAINLLEGYGNDNPGANAHVR